MPNYANEEDHKNLGCQQKKGDKKRERGRRRGVKTRRFSDWLKEGRKEFPLSHFRIID
jgi:hypothetical protein